MVRRRASEEGNDDHGEGAHEHEGRNRQHAAKEKFSIGPEIGGDEKREPRDSGDGAP